MCICSLLCSKSFIIDNKILILITTLMYISEIYTVIYVHLSSNVLKEKMLLLYIAYVCCFIVLDLNYNCSTYNILHYIYK